MMKIGVTSQNLRTVTGHAGKARRFLVYDGDRKLGTLTALEPVELPKEMSIHEFRGGQSHPIEAFDALITGSCGQGFVGHMVAMGIELYVTGETDPLAAARAVLEERPLPPPQPQEHRHRNSVQAPDWP